MGFDLVPRLQQDLNDLLTRLRQELEGKTANSPEAWKLLRNAEVETGYLRVVVEHAAAEI